MSLLLLLISLLFVPSFAALQYGITPGGFASAPKGWNSFALQAVKQFTFNQDAVIEQCDSMHKNLSDQGYKYCSVDSGWSIGAHGDDYGRIIYDSDNGWDIPALAEHLHSKGMLLGIYIVPGFFHDDENKYIYNTDPPIQLTTISNGNCQALARCQFNYSAAGVQEYCNSNVNQFAEWGVDLIKLDYVTPGSPQSGQPLDPDQSQVVRCYRNAIKQSGRAIRLDISWKLEYNDSKYYDIWANNADSLRLDQDINNGNAGDGQTSFKTVQRAIEMYRRYTVTMLNRTNQLAIYPDLDNLLVGNAQSRSGLTDDQRRIMYTHWIGAGANLILGSDMTELDEVGLAMLRHEQFNWLADNFTNKYPMVPMDESDDPSKGRQWQRWIAGPNEQGEAFLVWVNYGTSNLDLYSSSQDSGSSTRQLTQEDLVNWGLNATCYSALNLWNPNNNADLVSFSSLQTELNNEQVVALYLVPNNTATSCGEAVVER